MITTLDQRYDGENVFLHDASIDKAEYEPFKNRIIDQMVKSVSLNGFRTGFVPREMALKQLNPLKITETLMQEVMDRYTPEMISTSLTELAKDERSVKTVELDPEPEHTGEQTDGSFHIRIAIKLMPKINLKPLDTLKVDAPTISDIQDLPPETEFAKNEEAKLLREQNEFEETDEAAQPGYEATVSMSGTIKGVGHDGLSATGMKVVIGAGMFLEDFEHNIIGLKKDDTKTFDLTFPANYVADMAGKTATFEVTITAISKPKYNTIDDLIAHKKEFSDIYKTTNDFHADVKKVYQSRIDQLLENIFNKRVIEKMLHAIPDFEIEDELVEQETHRILHSMEHEAKDKGVTLGEVLSTSGLSPTEPAKLTTYTDAQVHDEVKAYTKNEIKLVNILSLIYETRLETKPTPSEVAKIIDEARKNKQKYNLAPDISDEQIRNIMNDRVIRQYGGNWLMEKIKKNNEILK
jgi:trigger factor